MTLLFISSLKGQQRQPGRSFSPHPVPPAMEQLNNSARVEESVRLARDLRARRDQMERLVQKNIFPSSGNELPVEGRRDSREGGRRKETNMAAGDSASQQLIRLQHQVGDDSYSWMTVVTAG